VRPFSDTDLAQAATGNATLTHPVSATVPAGTAEGNAGIIAMFAQTPVAAPAQWDLTATTGLGQLAIMCRADLPGTGESSWSFDTAAGTPANWTWTTGEWANVAPGPLETSAAATGTGGASSVSTGNTASFDTQYVMGIAAFGIFSAGGSAWPSVSYSGGFTETDSVQVGTGTANGDILLKVARLYGADSDTGPWSCTATFTGSMASKTPYAALAVFRAEETADPPMPVMTS
jgi:hypothetical protein